MGIISVEKADNLLWLGRYTERVHTTLKEFFISYDKMIDMDDDFYKDLCVRFRMPNVYESRLDFLKKYPFDETNPDSIMSNLMRAYDNAVILREFLGSETLSYIQLAVYAMQKARLGKETLVDLMRVTDYILAFWGSIDDEVDDVTARNIIKAGKRLERLDLYICLGIKNSEDLIRQYNRLIPRLQNSGLRYNESVLDTLEPMLHDPNMNYKTAIALLEKLFD